MSKLTPNSARLGRLSPLGGAVVSGVLAVFAPLASAATQSSDGAIETSQERRIGPLKGTPSAGASDLLSSLLQSGRAGELTPTTGAGALLSAGPEATAALYQHLDDGDLTSVPQALAAEHQRVRRILREVPPIIVGIATLPTLPAKDRAHALSVALEVLAATDPATSFPALTTVLRGAAAAPLPDSVLERIKRTTAALASHPEVSSQQVIQWIRAAGPRLSTSVIDGVSQSQAVMILLGCLGTETGAEGAILNRSAGLIQRGAPVQAEAAALATVPFLSSPGAFERKEASAILGLVGDRRHVEFLIKGLADDEHMVRTASLKALKELTGMTISGDPGRWQSWHLDQETWWTNSGSELVASIHSTPRRELIGVLKRVSTRRLYRKEIAAQLVQLLDRSRADEVRVAVAGLADLRDPSTLPSILALRSHPNEQVRETVEDAVVAFRHAGIKVKRVRGLPAH